MQLNLSFPPSFPSNVAYQFEKTQEKPTGTKKLHSISEVKFSRSSTPFDKDPKKLCLNFRLSVNLSAILDKSVE